MEYTDIVHVPDVELQIALQTLFFFVKCRYTHDSLKPIHCKHQTISPDLLA